MSHPTKPTLLCAAGVLVLLFVTSCLAAPVQKRQISSNQTETERNYHMRLLVGYHIAVSTYYVRLCDYHACVLILNIHAVIDMVDQ